MCVSVCRSLLFVVLVASSVCAPPGFDESLKALQDYDLWLTVVENGHPGRLLGGGRTYIHKFYLDHGISS